MLKKDRRLTFKNSKLYLYGAGKMGHEIAANLKYGIAGFFDRKYKEIDEINKIPVMNPADILMLDPRECILIVSIGLDEAGFIIQTLEKMVGWERNRNLFYCTDFMQNNYTEYMYSFGGVLNIPDFTLSVTTKCSLRCANCSQQLYKIKEQSNRNFLDLKTDLWHLFQLIDHIDRLAIVGGEPFMHPDLDLFLKELVKYHDKYDNCRIVTNATIIPSKSLLEFMSQNNIELELTDYNVPQSKIESIADCCRNHNVSYHINSHLFWLKMWNEVPEMRNYETEWIFQNCISANHCAGMVSGYITICICAFMYMLGGDTFYENNYLDLYKRGCFKIFIWRKGTFGCLSVLQWIIWS